MYSRQKLEWAALANGEEQVVDPRKPTQNGSVGCFNGRLRDELTFPTIFHARRAIEAWRMDYNTRRPHTSRGGLRPIEFIKQYHSTTILVIRGLIM